MSAGMLGTREAADRCGVAKRTMVRWCVQGRIPCYKIAGRWKVNAADLDHFLLSTRYNPVPREAAPPMEPPAWMG